MLIGKTLRFDLHEGWEPLDIEGYETCEIAYENKRRPVLVFWHDNIFLQAFFWRGAKGAILASQSFDGEYIARTAQRFGFMVVRGSSTRGGGSAIAKLITIARNGDGVSLTVDGPVGPRHIAKKGAVMLAKRSEMPLIPCYIAARKRWTINSWDKTVIPKPFSRVKVFAHEPVFVPRNASNEVVAGKHQELQSKLDDLQARGEEWRVAGK